MQDINWHARHARFIETLPEQALAVFFAAPTAQRSKDTEYYYRQDSDFLYLVGLNEIESAAVFIKNGDQVQRVIFSKEIDPHKTRWEGPVLGPQAAKERFGFDAAYPIESLGAVVAQSYLPGMKICTTLNPVTLSLFEQWLPTIPEEAFLEVSPLVHALRLIKSEDELDRIREAVRVSCLGHERAMKSVKPGMREYELEANILQAFYSQGARAVAYNTIVGAGDNACILHYIENNALIKDGDLVLIDAGAEVEGYAGDITRTFPANGQFTDVQRALYDLVLAAQTAAINHIKPGIPFSEIQDKILETVVPGLLSLGILTGDLNEIMKEKSYRSVYMHGSGHWMGLDVHDVGVYREADEDETSTIRLKPGMVLTVEPGIYIDSDHPTIPKKWHGLGIRIEDDILVTKNGCEVLSASLPKTVDTIEAFIQDNRT